MTGPRRRLALALDLDRLEEALVLARGLAPWFGIAKVGLELYSAAGPAAVERLAAEGFEVFVDLKLHDIPTTVRRSAGVLARLGAGYLTVHAAGGRPMLEAAVEGAATAGPQVAVLAVTVLTSEPSPPAGAVAERAALASAAGCAGVVCAVTEIEAVRAAAPGLLVVVPGTRPAGVPADDQARTGTPAQALERGASILVVGRAVTAAADPAAAAARLVASLPASGG